MAIDGQQRRRTAPGPLLVMSLAARIALDMVD
jgi:hypothetical protein